MAFTVTSENITNGAPIPSAHAVGVPTSEGRAALEGGNRNPHLRWSGAPAGTKSFAVLLVDTDVPANIKAINDEQQSIADDAPRQTLAHWLWVDIPPAVTEIAEGSVSDGFTPHGKPTGPAKHGGMRGANLYTTFFAQDAEHKGTYGGYDGPFPPWNDERIHHYHFQVFALDVPSLGLSGDFQYDDVTRAMHNHILAEAELVGTYTLHPALLGRVHQPGMSPQPGV